MLTLDEAFEQAKRFYPAVFIHTEPDGVTERRFALVPGGSLHPDKLVLQETRVFRFSEDDVWESPAERNHWGFCVPADHFDPHPEVSNTKTADLKHSRLPWHASGQDIICADGETVALVFFRDIEETPDALVEEAANVEFIVRACNKHDALVTTLRGLLDSTRGVRGLTSPCVPSQEAVWQAERLLVELTMTEETR